MSDGSGKQGSSGQLSCFPDYCQLSDPGSVEDRDEMLDSITARAPTDVTRLPIVRERP